MRRRESQGLRVLVCGLVAAAAAGAAAQTGEDVALETQLAGALALDDCIRIALDNNLELRVSRTNLAATATTVDEALGTFYPELSFLGQRSNLKFYGEFPEKDQHLRLGTLSTTQLLPLGTTVETSYSAMHSTLDPDNEDTPMKIVHFGITQPLLRGGGWRTGTASVKTARYDTRIAAAELRATELGVIQQVKTAYYEVIRQSKLIEVSAQAVQRDSLLVLQSRSKLEAGMGTKRDVLSAEIIQEQDRGKLVDAQTAHDDALDNLARVLGLRVGRRIAIAQRDVDLDTLTVSESAWTDKLLRDNPTLQSARHAVERAQLELHLAGNARLPQLDFTLSWEKFDDPDLNEELKIINLQRLREGKEPKDLEFTGLRGWSGLVTISYPLGNKSLGAAHQRARILRQQAQRTLEDVERQVLLELRTAIRSLDNSLQRLAILEKNIEGARSKLEFASINFQLGRASNLDITEAQKDLLDAEIDFVNEVIDYRVQVATIEALLGGFE